MSEDEIVLIDLLKQTMERYALGGSCELEEDLQHIESSALFTAIVFGDDFFNDEKTMKQVTFAKLLLKPFYFCVRQGIVLPSHITDEIPHLVVKYFADYDELKDLLLDANKLANLLAENKLE